MTARFAVRRCPAMEQQKISIQHTGSSTTIARVTCPTAPKFWRWRDLPFPRIEPREIELELEEDDHHTDEWKLQIAAAVLCGLAGFIGYFFGKFDQPALSIASFAVAYIAGARFPAEEVWERLQKRILDVHFLMIAVAVGAACIGAWAEGATLLFLFSIFRCAGALRAWPDAKGNPLPVP